MMELSLPKKLVKHAIRGRIVFPIDANYYLYSEMATACWACASGWVSSMSFGGVCYPRTESRVSLQGVFRCTLPPQA